ncbi:Cyanate hydratase [Hibiscus syriacus]|uniref:Cyanate hydratase n=1 Tax=Hibiscus syriacus TaxID=106335 RepID=A0A6A3A2I4_HIBSY|nr:Cyanate hydratase [Hibiscus syriacus]
MTRMMTRTTSTTVIVVGKELLKRQAQLKPETAPKLRAALPDMPDELLFEMMKHPCGHMILTLSRNPLLNEAVMHFGESIKEIINEEFGDGMGVFGFGCRMCMYPTGEYSGSNVGYVCIRHSMSAIDFYCSVNKVKGVDGKERVVITFDGKYLPYSEQVRRPSVFFNS